MADLFQYLVVDAIAILATLALLWLWRRRRKGTKRRSTLTATGLPGLVVGDVVEIPIRQGRWRRFLMWTRLAKAPDPGLFVVTAVAASSAELEEYLPPTTGREILMKACRG